MSDLEPSQRRRRLILGGWTVVFVAWTAEVVALLFAGHEETRLHGEAHGAPIGQGMVAITTIALFFLSRAWWRELRRNP
jgi:hypothetical protein